MVSGHLPHHWPSTIQQMVAIHNDIINLFDSLLYETSSRSSLSIDSLYKARGKEHFLIMDLGIKPNVFVVMVNFCSGCKYKTMIQSKDIIA